MGLVRRIEGAAEQADPHAGRMRGNDPLVLRQRLAADFWQVSTSRPGLTASANAVFEGRQLFDADRPARMQPAGGDADLGAEAELAAVGELGRGIMQHDG